MTRPTPLLLATRSEAKAREVRDILTRFTTAPVRTLRDLAIPPLEDEDGIEIHETFRANAVAKAEYFARRTGLAVLSDDSGIAVDTIAGAPGVRSRRFCSRADLDGVELDQANNALLLERLRGVPDERRTAHYVCVAALLDPGRPTTVAIGTVSGRIAHAPAGSHGFGYDPLFFFPPFGATFGQTPPALKHAVSHRGRAIRALAAVCAGQLRG